MALRIRKKILFVVLDGMGDYPTPLFGGQTPLEAAFTPYMDKLAFLGECGLARVIFKGDFPTSAEGHLSLFGYNPNRLAIGRGVFEALGVGLKLEKDDIALRGNFATVDKNLIIKDRRAGRIKNTKHLLKALEKALPQNVQAILKPEINHRFVMVLKGGQNLSDKIKGNDPQEVGIKPLAIMAVDNSQSSKNTAEILNDFIFKAHNILSRHPLNKKRIQRGGMPANFILLRGAGKIKNVESFKEKYNLRACFIAGGYLYKGVGRFLGMKEIKVRGATGTKNTNLNAKFREAVKSLRKFDFCFLHIKATDIFGHDGDCQGKKNFIEKVDKTLGKAVFGKGEPNFRIVITCDHRTPCSLKEHSFDPVPLLVFGTNRDKAMVFSERECARQGGLGEFSALDLMKKVIYN